MLKIHFFAQFFVHSSMKFWINSGYNFHSLTLLEEDKLLLLVDGMSREDIIEWLSWNDPNGIYKDEHSLKELGNTMTREEGLEILLRQVGENRIII
ncbi:hypothetical protein [Mucilaginibacter sp. 3215]|uniref:hypothetical protein n=1 Tax=Mucilaginibacter sp. 3215 TaxID=3373912 RepID=UPI003D1919A0